MRRAKVHLFEGHPVTLIACVAATCPIPGDVGWTVATETGVRR